MKTAANVLGVTVIATAMLFSCSHGGSGNRKGYNNMARTVLDEIERLDSLPQWTVKNVAGLVGVGLDRDDQMSDDRLTVFRAGSPSSLWQSVELRISATPGHRALLVLRPQRGKTVSMNDVVARFGQEISFSPPNPRAPADEPTAFYEFKRPQGVLRAGFRNFDHFDAGVFTLDRM
jgi:hypothetical protein